MFGFCRRDCAVVVTVYHSHLPLLFYFQAQVDEKCHPKKSTSEVWNFEKQAVHFGESGSCGGFASSGCATVFHCRTFPQLAYATAQLRPHNPPPSVTVGINMPVLGWTCRKLPWLSGGVKEHLAGSWGGVLREGNNRAQSRGKTPEPHWQLWCIGLKALFNPPQSSGSLLFQVQPD